MPGKPHKEKMLPKSAAMVIFGATGDLTQRKLIPALYQLYNRGHLPKEYPIVCFARRESDDTTFRELARASFVKFTKKKPDQKVWTRFAQNIKYFCGDLNDDDSFRGLKERLDQMFSKLKDKTSRKRILYYFATAPEHFGPLVDSLHSLGLASRQEGPDAWPRLVFEKPFGSDLASARSLNKRIQTVFDENQIYRIDHYLGKESVQNILVMRFANSIFEQVWNSKFIDNIQITSAETVGVETRAGYYETSGALRDMVQNHLMQLLTYVAMEPPTGLGAEEIHEEKVKVLKALRPLCCDSVRDCAVRGQYGPGKSEGKKAVEYRQETGVAKNSRIETFAALTAHVHNWRWEGVPFYLRTGKRMKRRTTEIVVTFKKAPGVLFNDDQRVAIEPNRLILRIQPDEGIALQFNSKRPVTNLAIDPVLMDFCHSCIFSPNTPEAYERLIHDALIGDSTLFTRWDEVELAWAFVDPIRKAWDANKKPIPTYAPGTWGPKEAERLLLISGRKWFEGNGRE
ncbi:MAG: glucose-6-phosphate dehydrogenase [Nanoarchaeota archaeon]